MYEMYLDPVEPVDPSMFEDFILYLNDHLSDNGKGPFGLFQPLPPNSRLPSEKENSFRHGMTLSVGTAGWRRAWVARAPDRRILGHVDLRSHPERFSEHRCLLGMGVDRNYRRLGLGARLLAHAQEWAVASTDLEWIDLQVLSTNEPAIRLYLRAGFAKIGEIPEMFKIEGRSYSHTLMAKRIRAVHSPIDI
jgi:ribosomal protein S18 acetylase RimI-like enzyme